MKTFREYLAEAVSKTKTIFVGEYVADFIKNTMRAKSEEDQIKDHFARKFPTLKISGKIKTGPNKNFEFKLTGPTVDLQKWINKEYKSGDPEMDNVEAMTDSKNKKAMKTLKRHLLN